MDLINPGVSSSHCCLFVLMEQLWKKNSPELCVAQPAASKTLLFISCTLQVNPGSATQQLLPPVPKRIKSPAPVHAESQLCPPPHLHSLSRLLLPRTAKVLAGWVGGWEC